MAFGELTEQHGGRHERKMANKSTENNKGCNRQVGPRYHGSTERPLHTLPGGAISEVIYLSTVLRDQVGARLGWRSKVLGRWGLVGKLLARRNICKARKQELECNSTSLKHGK